MDIIKEYIIEQALVLIPVLLILGFFIKETDLIKDKFIPLVLLGAGVAFAIALLGFDVQAVIQGVLVAGAAVFANQLYKQKQRDDE